MNGRSNNNFTVRMNEQEGKGQLLQVVIDAMLDCLTVEQQTKMASYLLRTARQQANTRTEQQADSTAVGVRAY